MSEIKTYLFIAIKMGKRVTDSCDTQNLSEDKKEREQKKKIRLPKLIVVPVSREELTTKTLALNHVQFDFFPVEGFLKDHDLKFPLEEYKTLVDYIKTFPGPVALVAYGGFTSEFAKLYRAIQGFSGPYKATQCFTFFGLPADLRCVDLLQGIYETDNDFEPQNPRDDGKLPWEYQRSEMMREYAFPLMFLRTLGYDCKLADEDEGLPLNNLGATVRWAAEYQPLAEWLQEDTSYTYFKDFAA